MQLLRVRPSFCVNNLSSIDRFYMTEVDVIKFLAPSKIRTRDHCTVGALSTWFRGIILWCIIMMMTAEKATKLGHDQVLRVFVVDIQQSFICIFRRRDDNDLSQFGLSWTKPKVMLSVATNYSLFYSLRRRKSIITGTTIPLYVIICRRRIARPHQNWTKCGFQDINLSGFNSLNRNVIVVCRQWRDSRVRASNVLKYLRHARFLFKRGRFLEWTSEFLVNRSCV